MQCVEKCCAMQCEKFCSAMHCEVKCSAMHWEINCSAMQIAMRCSAMQCEENATTVPKENDLLIAGLASLNAETDAAIMMMVKEDRNPFIRCNFPAKSSGASPGHFLRSLLCLNGSERGNSSARKILAIKSKSNRRVIFVHHKQRDGDTRSAAATWRLYYRRRRAFRRELGINKANFTSNLTDSPINKGLRGVI
jgi:hypothetical protein